MKERIAAIINLILAIGWGIYSVKYLLDDPSERDILIIFSLLIFSVSTILYVLWTKLGKKELSELEILEKENKLLEKQIEQKELKKKLDE